MRVRWDEEDIIGRTSFLYKGLATDICVYKPQKKWADGDEFVCRISILGPEIRYRADVVGYDSMQSIILAVRSVGAYLEDNAEIDGRFMEWPGGSPNFPSLS
jgi:hypothetical protein